MYRNRVIGVCLVAIVVVLAGCDITTVINPQPTATPTAPLGPPASWSAQYTLARQEANKIDSGAFLWKVVSDPLIDDNPPRFFDFSKPLHLDFTFVTISGHFDIVIADSDPPIVLGEDVTQTRTNSDNPTSPATLAVEFGPGEQTIAAIKIGPREAYAKTISESRQFAHTPTISVEAANTGKGTAALWTVGYIEANKDMLFRIDSRSGGIVGRDRVLPQTSTAVHP